MMKTVNFNDLSGSRLLADKLFFPECPRYFGGEIYFVDGSAVRAADLRGGFRTVADIPTQMCLGLDVLSDGTIYVACPFDRKIFKIENGSVSLFADLSSSIHTLTNELVRLPGGEFIIGEMGFNPLAGTPPGPGRLHILGIDGEVRPTGPPIGFPNGMILRDGGRTLFLSGDFGVMIYRLNIAPGGEVTVVEQMPIKADPAPMADGIALDRAGNLWYGDMGIGAAVRRGHDGRPDVIVKTPRKHSTSCWLFTENGQEWLAICVTDVGPEGDPNHQTGQVLAVPMSSVMAA